MRSANIRTCPRLAILCAGVVIACGRSPTGSGALATITVTPDATLSINSVQQFVATGRDASGQTVSIAPAWEVVAGGGSITAGGLFTAGMSPGVFTATIRATSGSRSGTATVTVTAGVLASIEVGPNSVTLAMTGTQQFAAVGMDGAGNVIPIAPAWSVAIGGGVITTGGLFTAGGVPGVFPATVRAVSGGIAGAATVTVAAGGPGIGVLATITVSPVPALVAINGVRQFSAVGRDVDGGLVEITPSWTVVAGGGTISDAGLFVAGTTIGSFPGTIKATSGSVSGTASVTVTVGAPATIVLSPDPVSLAIGGSQQFTAVGADAAGNVVPITPVWAAISGTISATGLFTAGPTAGSYPNSVRAQSDGVTGFASVTIIAAPLAMITVSPGPAALAPGGIVRASSGATVRSASVMVTVPPR